MDEVRDIKRSDLKTCKKETIKIARELLYSQEIIYKIRNAKTTAEIYRIMHTARKEELEYE